MKTALTMILACMMAWNTSASAADEHPVDLVICLDTSGSMQGLIEAAKQKLWDIVNELGRAKPKPHLRVGLYVYGSPGYGAPTGYVKKLIDLTDDLDSVYEQLIPLRTEGGNEYVARVVRAAVMEQPWSKGKDALKIIIVAGNEPATQDQMYNSLEIAKQAITADIIVNTIYCGSPAHREAEGWRDVARAADGQFASIDQDRGTIVINTPFDAKLVELSAAINRTYVAYGREGRDGHARQEAADVASMQASPAAAASRAGAKAGGQYRNQAWDLVDAREQKDFDLANVKDEDLPPEMQSMTLEQRRQFLDEKAKERAIIQQQINQMSRQRQDWIAEELKRTGQSADKAFDAALLAAIRAQAARKGIRCD